MNCSMIYYMRNIWKKTSKENIFVFRWKMKTDNSFNAEASDYITIDSKNKKREKWLFNRIRCYY